MFRPLASTLIVGTWSSAMGGESGALMQSQSRNEDALEFVNNKERVQLAELHKTMLSHHREYKEEVERKTDHRQGGYHAHLTKHRDAATGAVSTSGHVEKMKKTARELEHEYRTILEMMVQQPKLGNEYQPPTEMISEVESVFDVIEHELGVESTASQSAIDKANENIKKCNDNKDNEYNKADGVNAMKATSDGNRNTHKDCRHAENALICKTFDECEKFNGQAKCGHEQNWFAKLLDTSIPTKQTLTLAKVITQAETCRSDLAVEHTKAAECDRVQGTFETSFCYYADKLQETSDQYDQCYEAENNTRYNVVEPAVKKLEFDGKLILKMTKKVRCYIESLKNVQYTSELPMQQDIDKCTALDPDTTELDIAYTTPEPKAVLDLSTIEHWPSVPDNGWADDEYSTGLFQDDCKKGKEVPAWQAALHPTKLKEVVVCTEMNARQTI